MPLLQQLLTRLSGGARSPEQIAGESRLARVSRKPSPALERRPVELTLDALEEDCAQPLYDRSVYGSPPQDPAEA